jgi:hypothetical protein
MSGGRKLLRLAWCCAVAVATMLYEPQFRTSLKLIIPAHFMISHTSIIYLAGAALLHGCVYMCAWTQIFLGRLLVSTLEPWAILTASTRMCPPIDDL